MKIGTQNLLAGLALLLTVNSQFSTAHAQGTAFSYQGRLQNNGNPANGSYDLSFTMFNTNANGVAVAGPVTNSAVGVTNGLFTTTVDFGNVFYGTSNWLQIAVSTNGADAFFPLTPRQQLTPVPYAEFASSVSGLGIQQNSDGAPNVILGSSVNSISGGVEGATIGGGGTTNYLGTPYSNSVAANFGTVAGGYGNKAGDFSTTVGGGELNIASRQYATVSGGADNTASGDDATVAGGAGNQATNVHATVGGGYDNTAGGVGAFVGGGGNDGTTFAGNTASGNASVVSGGLGNQATNIYATVGGGYQNTAGGVGAVVGGGGHGPVVAEGNTASGNISVVAGGLGNQATNAVAVVGGGYQNTAGGIASTVAGGENNLADGTFSFAAGQQAQALNIGSFVWADSQSAVFASTNNDSFNVRAQGGGRFVTSGAGLTVDGPVAATSFNGNIIGGYAGNVVSNGIVGVFIGGGGYAGNPNIVGADYASVLGGQNNVASGPYSTAMGESASASGYDSLATGGTTVASGTASTAMGGGTIAHGDYSTAMGYFAYAANNGTFVWADNTSQTLFTSSAPNQFLVRAAGGVGINTTNPAESLTVGGVTSYNTGLKLTGSTINGTGMAIENTASGGHKYDLISGGSASQEGAGAFELFDETAARFDLTIATNGDVGIGTTSPTNNLQVVGGVTATEIKVDNGQFYAAAGDSPLRVVRGFVNGNGTIASGSGFTVTHTAGTSAYTINYTTAFTDVPAVTITTAYGVSSGLAAIGGGSVGIQLSVEGLFTFVAIGGR